MNQGASNGRCSLQLMHRVPIYATIRQWRSLNCDITHRQTEYKESAELNAKRYEHVISFECSIRNVQFGITDIFDNLYHL